MSGGPISGGEPFTPGMSSGGVIMIWSPIESAPRDGARVLLAAAGKAPWIGYWVDTKRYEYGKLAYESQYWTDANPSLAFTLGDSKSIAPTHWMPLPSFEVEGS